MASIYPDRIHPRLVAGRSVFRSCGARLPSSGKGKTEGDVTAQWAIRFNPPPDRSDTGMAHRSKGEISRASPSAKLKRPRCILRSPQRGIASPGNLMPPSRPSIKLNSDAFSASVAVFRFGSKAKQSLGPQTGHFNSLSTITCNNGGQAQIDIARFSAVRSECLAGGYCGV